MEESRNTSLINAMLIQLNNINIDLSNNLFNTYQTTAVNFINLSFDSNNHCILPRYLHVCNPEYLVFNLINSDESINLINSLLSNMSFSINIGNHELVNLPISFLFSYKNPQIIDNKLYIDIPLQFIFGDISLIGLNNQSNYILKIHNNSLQNYVYNFSLICKIKMYAEIDRNGFIDMSFNMIHNIIQKTESINVPSSEFQFNSSTMFNSNISLFEGILKGIYIESPNIRNNLSELQFYVNSNLNRYYDKFLIRTKTTFINENLIYIGFNPEQNENSRNYNNFTGSLIVSNNDNCVLNLTFTIPLSTIKIYLLKGIIFRRSNYYSYINNYQNNYQNNNYSYGQTGPSNYNVYYNTLNTTPTITTNNTQVISNSATLPEGQTIYLPIEHGRNTCGILHEQILNLQTYMMCSLCNANFNENALKNWLRHRSESNRTCPFCRDLWSNYNIYINANSPN